MNKLIALFVALVLLNLGGIYVATLFPVVLIAVVLGDIFLLWSIYNELTKKSEEKVDPLSFEGNPGMCVPPSPPNVSGYGWDNSTGTYVNNRKASRKVEIDEEEEESDITAITAAILAANAMSQDDDRDTYAPPEDKFEGFGGGGDFGGGGAGGSIDDEPVSFTSPEESTNSNSYEPTVTVEADMGGSFGGETSSTSSYESSSSSDYSSSSSDYSSSDYSDSGSSGSSDW